MENHSARNFHMELTASLSALPNSFYESNRVGQQPCKYRDFL